MALFLRGRKWWFEIRKPGVRIVHSTGFYKADRAKAEAVYQAALIGVTVKPARSVTEKLLDAIYFTAPKDDRLKIEAMWPLYDQWFNGKGKVVEKNTWVRRRNRFSAFASWASGRGLEFAEDVTVGVARQYIASLGGANKTRRVKAMELSGIWSACGEMTPGIHNPWKAACPADDGSGERRDTFSDEQIESILSTAKSCGHEWYGVCMAGLWTGQRYGDCCTLVWGRAQDAMKAKKLEHGVVDLDELLIVVDPMKTRRHGTRVVIPISAPLADALSSIDRREGFVFMEQAMCYIHNEMVSPSFADVLAKAGVTDGYYDFHSFRHTFRSRLGDAQVSDATANRFGGWTSPRMGAHYDHARHIDEMREALSAVEKKTGTP